MKAKQGEAAEGLLTPDAQGRPQRDAQNPGFLEHLNKGTDVGNCDEIKGRTRAFLGSDFQWKTQGGTPGNGGGYRSLHTRSIAQLGLMGLQLSPGRSLYPSGRLEGKTTLTSFGPA